MKTIDYFKKNKISKFLISNKKWMDKYQEKILELYKSITIVLKSSGQSLGNSDEELLLKIKNLIIYFQKEHDKADIVFADIGDYNMYNNVNLFSDEKQLEDGAEDIFLKDLKKVVRSLEKNIIEDQNYICSYLGDFNTHMLTLMHIKFYIDDILETKKSSLAKIVKCKKSKIPNKA